MWPFMLAVLDHPGLAYLESNLCFKIPIFDTNKKTHKRYHLLFQGKLASHILATDEARKKTLSFGLGVFG